jgi:hypothetical protein
MATMSDTASTLTRPRKKSRPVLPVDSGAVSNGSGRGHETAEHRNELLLAAMVAFRDGDFSVRLPSHWPGADARIAEAFNQAIGHTERMSSEITRLSATVGKEGRLRPAHVAPRRHRRLGAEAESFNTLIDDLVARPPKSRAPSAPSRAATLASRWTSKSTAAS